MNKEIKVLNHGMVRLIDNMGSDLSIVRNARVSYDAEWRTGKDAGKDEKLINFLYNNGHNTPFESATITFEIKAPIFVFRQWHRHRTQSYNELSARYKELPEKFFVPDIDQITTQSIYNKQMRTNEINEHAVYIQNLIKIQNKSSFEIYHEMLSRGCPREIARSILPVGTYSHMFTTANLHNMFRFLSERLHPHAQQEIRVYAQAILKLIEPLYPVCVEAFKNGLDKAD